MTTRIGRQVIRGDIDNRVKGTVTGHIWLAGRIEPLELNLRGNASADLAGRIMCFVNPSPQAGPPVGLATLQHGMCGNMTAARKVKVPLVPTNQWFTEHPKPSSLFHWADAIHLEWFSQIDGRLVVESSDFYSGISSPSWLLTPIEAVAQQEQKDAARGFSTEQLLALVQGMATPKIPPQEKPTCYRDGRGPTLRH